MINNANNSENNILTKPQMVFVGMISLSFNTIILLKGFLIDHFTLCFLLSGTILAVLLILVSQLTSEQNKTITFFGLISFCYLYPFLGTCFILNNQQEYILYIFFLVGFFIFLSFINYKYKECYLLLSISFAFYIMKLIFPDIYLTLQVKNFYLCTLVFLLIGSYNSYKVKFETEKNYKTKIESKKKIENLKILGGAIAHELRTPLSTLMFSSQFLGDVLPNLLKFRKKLSHDNDDIGKTLNAYQLKYLEDLPNVLMRNSREASLFIDSLLEKIKTENKSVNYTEICDSTKIIEKVMEDYPFTQEEKKLINISLQNSFLFVSNTNSMKHVFYNLLRNAFYQIKKNARGKIKIWFSQTLKFNEIHFKDTAIGIKDADLVKLLAGELESSSNGTGLGFVFCKLVVESSGGMIKCQSKFGEFIEFTLCFPLVIC